MARIQCRDDPVHIVNTGSIACRFAPRDPLSLPTLLELESTVFHFHLRLSQSDDS